MFLTCHSTRHFIWAFCLETFEQACMTQCSALISRLSCSEKDLRREAALLGKSTFSVMWKMFKIRHSIAISTFEGPRAIPSLKIWCLVTGSIAFRWGTQIIGGSFVKTYISGFVHCSTGQALDKTSGSTSSPQAGRGPPSGEVSQNSLFKQLCVAQSELLKIPLYEAAQTLHSGPCAHVCLFLRR